MWGIERDRWTETEREGETKGQRGIEAITPSWMPVIYQALDWIRYLGSRGPFGDMFCWDLIQRSPDCCFFTESDVTRQRRDFIALVYS